MKALEVPAVSKKVYQYGTIAAAIRNAYHPSKSGFWYETLQIANSEVRDVFHVNLPSWVVRLMPRKEPNQGRSDFYKEPGVRQARKAFYFWRQKGIGDWGFAPSDARLYFTHKGRGEEDFQAAQQTQFEETTLTFDESMFSRLKGEFEESLETFLGKVARAIREVHLEGVTLRHIDVVRKKKGEKD